MTTATSGNMAAMAATMEHEAEVELQKGQGAAGENGVAHTAKDHAETEAQQAVASRAQQAMQVSRDSGDTEHADDAKMRTSAVSSMNHQTDGMGDMGPPPLVAKRATPEADLSTLIDHDTDDIRAPPAAAKRARIADAAADPTTDPPKGIREDAGSPEPLSGERQDSHCLTNLHAAMQQDRANADEASDELTGPGWYNVHKAHLNWQVGA